MWAIGLVGQNLYLCKTGLGFCQQTPIFPGTVANTGKKQFLPFFTALQDHVFNYTL
jgi:hypothetical protein